MNSISEETTTKEDVLKGLRIIADRAFAYKGTLLFLVFLAVVTTLGNAIVPYLTGKAFDAILEPRVSLMGTVSTSLLGIVTLFAVTKGLANLADWRLRLRTETLGYTVQGEYIHDALKRLFRLPLSFHNDTKFGDTTTRIHRARSGYRQLFSHVTRLIPSLASIVVACAFVFAINTTLALVLLGGVVLFVGVFIWQVLPTGKLMREANDAFSDLFGNAWDGLQNPRLIKLVGTETKEAEAVYDEFTTNTMPTWMNLYRVWQSLSFMQKMIVLTTQIAIIVVGAPLVQANTLTVGELIAFNGYANLVYGPFIQLGYQWQSIQNSLLDIVKSEEMLATEPENYKGGRADISLRKPISFKDVSFTYDEDEGEVLSDISFGVEFGQTVALVGESGEGKSTLVDLIPRFIEPSSGKIYIGNTETGNINLAYLRNSTALVPQRITLFNRTIEKNMTYGLEATRQEMIAAAKQAQAHEFITDTYDGYESIVGERGLKLSAGESQRIALARAFLADPAILILDEPTSALDAKNEKLITDVLEDLWQDRTTFIIAHRLSTVHNADTILVLKDGRIAEQGSHNDLINKDGEYKRLHDLQIGLHQ